MKGVVWYYKVFLYMVEVCVSNAHILHTKSTNNADMRSFDFRRKLVSQPIEGRCFWIDYLPSPIIHLFYPPPRRILHNHCLQVLLGHEDVPREIKNNAYANSWGVKEVYYGICASSEWTRDHTKYPFPFQMFNSIAITFTIW